MPPQRVSSNQGAAQQNSLDVLEHSCVAHCHGHDCQHGLLLQCTYPTDILNQENIDG
jgi:uncharacterized protein YuzB (UPF0349 family)